jgi:hypothetical protein
MAYKEGSFNWYRYENGSFMLKLCEAFRYATYEEHQQLAKAYPEVAKAHEMEDHNKVPGEKKLIGYNLSFTVDGHADGEIYFHAYEDNEETLRCVEDWLNSEGDDDIHTLTLEEVFSE